MGNVAQKNGCLERHQRNAAVENRGTIGNDLTNTIERIRLTHPRARLNAVYDARGEFKAWRIVSGHMVATGRGAYWTVDVVLSGLHADDEAAWADAKEKLV